MLLFPITFIVVAVIAGVSVSLIGKGGGGLSLGAQKNATYSSWGSTAWGGDEVPPPPPPAAPPPPLTPLQQEFLDAHNEVRDLVGLPHFGWDVNLERFAQTYAAEIQCVLRHSAGSYGENLFWGYLKKWSATDAVNAWAGEVKWYNYDINTCETGRICGHYTQIVWSTTTLVGCAVQNCTNSVTYIVCEYFPRGNLVGRKPY